MPDLSALLAPRSVAVIGASDDPASIRGLFMKTILRHGYTGAIHGISRSSPEVFGHKTYDHISKAPGPIDLAVLIAPAEACPDVLGDCARAGVRAAIVIASGFAEEGSARGLALQEELRAIAADNDIALNGPNSQGFIDTRSGLAATFSPVAMGLEPVLPNPPPPDRGLAIVTQSGALGFGLFDTALATGKPVVVLRAGRSASGRRAAASHTSALAGGDAGYGAVFRRYGIVEAVSTGEAVALAGALVACATKPEAGRRVGICSSTGGGAGLVADLCEEAGLTIPTLDDATRATLDAVLPSYGVSTNPVDATAQAIRKIGYAGLAGTVAGSATVDAVIAAVSGRLSQTSDDEADALAALGRDCPKPIVFWCYTPPNDHMRRTMERAGLPLVTDSRAAVRVIDALARTRVLRERDTVEAPAETDAPPLPPRTILTEHEAFPLLVSFGATVAAYGLATSADQAVARFRERGGPVALKIQSPDIAHKSDAGGVALDLDSEDAVGAAYDAIMERVGRAAPDAAIDGILVQDMAATGVEVILGVTMDPRFGPLVMAGLGGVFVEVLGDTAFAPAPLGPEEAHDLLMSLKGWPLLAGERGGAPGDVVALVELMVGLSRFAWVYRDVIEEIDLNPVMVHPEGHGVTVVDALIVQREAGDQSGFRRRSR